MIKFMFSKLFWLLGIILKFIGIIAIIGFFSITPIIAYVKYYEEAPSPIFVHVTTIPLFILLSVSLIFLVLRLRSGKK